VLSGRFEADPFRPDCNPVSIKTFCTKEQLKHIIFIFQELRNQ
jgi:hypothetical protein